MMKTVLVTLSAMIIYSKNQMTMVVMIIIICTSLSSLMFLLSNIHWFSLLMMLIYISGIMVLFMFIVSMAPNEKTLLKPNKKSLFLVFLVFFLPFKLACVSENLKINSSFESSNMLMMLIGVVILFMAYLPPKIISSFYSGMKTTK